MIRQLIIAPGPIAILVPGESALLLWFQQTLIQLVFCLEVLNLLILELDADLFHGLLGLAQFFFLDLVEELELVLEVVQVAVLDEVDLLQAGELLLKALVFLHEGWFDGHQVFVSLLGSLKLSGLFLQLLF